MLSSLKKAILVSVLLHGLLFLILNMRPKAKAPLQPTWVQLEPSEPMEVHYQKSNAQKSDDSKPSKPKKKKKIPVAKSKKAKGSAGQGARLKGFLPTPIQSGGYQEHIQKGEEEGSWGDEVMQTMNGMGLEEYSENYNFFEFMAGHLNRHLLYPKELWEHKITGKIWIKILIDRKGKLLTVLDSSKRHSTLLAYLLIQTYKVLEKELPEKNWYSKDKNLALILNFDYRVSAIDTVKEEKSVRYFKNRFEFKRVAKIPNFMAELSRDYARYIPPIAPIPGGFIVNFVQVYNFIEAWRGDDPLVQKRNKKVLDRERLQRLLQQVESHHQESKN